MSLVLSSGQSPNDIMLIGECPGQVENSTGKPFSGPSGHEHNLYLAKCGRGYHSSRFYMTNLCKEYTVGNPDPTPRQIAEWTPYLEDEIREVQPKVIFAVGRYSTWWLLGGVDTRKGRQHFPMSMLHGVPCRGGQFDESIAHRVCGAVVVPCYHPAAGLREEKMKPLVFWDYKQAVDTYEHFNFGTGQGIDGLSFRGPVDEFEGEEVYADVTGEELSLYLSMDLDSTIGIDTEHTAANPWIQISPYPGTAYLLRSSQPDFARGVKAIQRVINRGVIVVVHFGLHDAPIMRAMGLDLSRSRIINTNYMAFTLCVEPQGLKPLSWRHNGMLWRLPSNGDIVMSYNDLIGNAALGKQIDYLRVIERLAIPKVGKVKVKFNNGEFRDYSPASPSTKAAGIIRDVENDKRDKDDKPVNVTKRWNNDSGEIGQKLLLKNLRLEVEKYVGGPMPQGNLDDVEEFDDAKYYACRDADATLRDYHKLLPIMVEQGVA